MALTTIEYGSLASSATLNNNFNYLDGRITTTATSVSSLSSQISTINTNLTNNKANKDLSNITNGTLSANITFSGTNTFSGDTIFSGAVTLPDGMIYVKTTYTNGTSGYRIWSDGYCEQWGYCTSTGTNLEVALTKTFTDTNYHVYSQQIGASGGYEYNNCQCILTRNTSNFHAYRLGYGSGFFWRACGYLAEGQY